VEIELFWADGHHQVSSTLSKLVYVLKRDSELLGYISFWPLTKKSFHDFLSGKRLESQISWRCIELSNNAESTYWYIGSIALITKFRQTKAIRLLLREAVLQWLEDLSPATNIYMCALGYSEQGENLLSRFGFNKLVEASQSPHRLSVYTRMSSSAKLRSELDVLFPQSNSTSNAEAVYISRDSSSGNDNKS